MIFNTNKIVECNNKSKSLSYYVYTSEIKYSDLSKQLHDNFCKNNNKNTATLLNSTNRNESSNFNNKIHKSSSPKKTSKNRSLTRKGSPIFPKNRSFRKGSPNRSFRKNNR